MKSYPKHILLPLAAIWPTGHYRHLLQPSALQFFFSSLWKETIGPLEARKSAPNIWRYHQTRGLGYFEYFQFCEDIGAEPLPVVAAGVPCQHEARFYAL